MAKQTDTDPMPLGAPTNTAAVPSENTARRRPKDEELSGEALLQGLLNGPRAPFRPSQAAQSDGNDEGHFHAGPRAPARGREEPSPEPGIVLSPSVVESPANRERDAGSQLNVATVVLPRVRRRSARRLASGMLLLATLVGLAGAAIGLLRARGGSSVATSPPVASGSSSTALSASYETPTTPPSIEIPVANPVAAAASAPSEALLASPKIVQARPPATHPSPSMSARPPVRKTHDNGDLGEF